MTHLLALTSYIDTHVMSIVLSILASFVLGFIWYGPLFGAQWMAYNNITKPKKEDMKFSMMLPGISASIVAVFVQSAVLGRMFEIMQPDSIGQVLLIATILWLPFTALTIVNSYAWSGKRIGHMSLEAGYYLFSIWTTAAILYATL